jgi:hypothetical protein
LFDDVNLNPPPAPLSPHFSKLLDELTDELTPGSVGAWRLEGESGARVETRGTIAFIVRRRVAGATYRAMAQHVLRRLWWIGGPRVNPSSGAPDAGDVEEDEEEGDAFRDPYSRFAGRSSAPQWRYR